MQKKQRETLKAFGIELIIYSFLVVVYFLAVLHFVAEWVNHLDKTHIQLYAVVSILLIIGQAILLEAVTTWIMRLLRGGRSE